MAAGQAGGGIRRACRWRRWRARLSHRGLIETTYRLDLAEPVEPFPTTPRSRRPHPRHLEALCARTGGTGRARVQSHRSAGPSRAAVRGGGDGGVRAGRLRRVSGRAAGGRTGHRWTAGARNGSVRWRGSDHLDRELAGRGRGRPVWRDGPVRSR
jgi:hypothetical protein